MTSIHYRASRLVIEVGVDANASNAKQITDWPGWKRSGRVVSAYPWPSAVLAVDLTTPGLNLSWSPEAAAVRDRVLGQLQLAREALAGTILPMGTWPTERAPMPHQMQAVAAARNMGWRALIADDMGLGKTSVALWCAHDANANRLLVICPASVKFNWKREIETTLGQDWNTIVIDGTAPKRADQLVYLKGSVAEKLNTACVINYDLLLHLKPDQIASLNEFAAIAFVVCDESHYLKSVDSARTKMVRELIERSVHVLLMSGTPIRNLADDLFSQVELIRPGTWVSFHDFADRHLVVRAIDFGSRKPVRKVVGTKNLDALNAVMNTLQIRRAKEDVLNLPPKIITYPELQLDDVARRIYSEMKNFAKLSLAELAPDTSIWEPRAKSAVEAAMRCEQIAQGFVGGIPEPLMQRLAGSLLKGTQTMPQRPRELIFPQSPKLQWTLDACETIRRQGGKAVVFSRFNAPMFWLAGQLTVMDFAANTLHGGMSSVERQEMIDAFQAGYLDVLICQVRIAEGFNLTRSQDCLFLGRDWSPSVNDQAIARMHRFGQSGTVNVQIPIVRDTVEVMIDRRLGAKNADAQSALKTLTIGELMKAL